MSFEKTQEVAEIYSKKVTIVGLPRDQKSNKLSMVMILSKIRVVVMILDISYAFNKELSVGIQKT